MKRGSKMLVAVGVGVFMTLCLTPARSNAQQKQLPQQEVHAAIERIFEGMRAADPDRVREVLADGMEFAVLDDTGETVTIRYVSPEGWLNAMAQSGGAWDEQVYDVQIRVDGNMGSAWVPYTFYANGEISHCGINSIEFLRDTEGWKATHLSDTRRTEDCPDPHGG